MTRRLLFAATALLCALAALLPARASAQAQTVWVLGTLTDSTGTVVQSGTITFAPVDNQGRPISFQIANAGGGGWGQVISMPVTATVSDGQFGLSLPDTSKTQPANVCFAVSAVDNVTGDSLLAAGSYSCVQPSSDYAAGGGGYGWCYAQANDGNTTTCNFNNYVPNNPALTVTTIQGGSDSVTASSVDAVGNITNSTLGNAATATALASTPTPCTGGQLAGGIDVHGNSINCATGSGGTVKTNPSVAAETTANPSGALTISAADVGASQAQDPGSTFAQIANRLLARNHFFFSDGTDGWCAAPFYCGLPPNSGPAAYSMYGADTIISMLSNPSHFTAAQFLNLVNKFVAAKNTNASATYPLGDFPEVVKQSGAAGQFCSGDDNYCHSATGDGRIAVPLALYLYWQRTGDLTPYTANVAAIKTAMSNPVRNGTTHLLTVVEGEEDVPGIGFLEQMRPLGDVADANVWDAWDAKAMQLMATAAGDSTNATYFGNIYTQDVTGITTTLTDSSSKLLWFATGSQMHVLDIVDSTLAAYPLLGASVGPLLGGSQISSIGTWLDSNYSSLVNSANGYVKMVNSCDVEGAIPSGGGAPYTSDGNSTTTYQCADWATFGGFFAYTLGQVDPMKASTYLQTYESAYSPWTEWFAAGSSVPTASYSSTNGVPDLLTAGQSMLMASELFPATPTQDTTLICVLDPGNRCAPYVSNPDGFGVNTLTVPYVLSSSVTGTINSFEHLGYSYAPSAADGAHLMLSVGVGNSTSGEAYLAWVKSTSTGVIYGSLGLSGHDDIATIWPGNNSFCVGCGSQPTTKGWVNGDFGTWEIVGANVTPSLSFASGSGTITSDSGNIDGQINVTATGTLTFTMTWGASYAYAHRANCQFTDETTHADTVQTSSATTTTLTASGTATSGDAVTYICAGR